MSRQVLMYAMSQTRRVTLSMDDSDGQFTYFVNRYHNDDAMGDGPAEFAEYPDAYGVYLDMAIDMLRRERTVHRGHTMAEATIRTRPRVQTPRNPLDDTMS